MGPQSDAERARQYRARKGATTRKGLQPCGTLAAYRRHLRNSEQACPACAQAWADYQRDYQQKRSR